MNTHNFIKMFATIFIPMWAGGWTRRYSEGSSKLTHAWPMILYEFSLSKILSLHNHYSTPRHAQKEMTTLCQKACSTDLTHIHTYSLFGTHTQGDYDHTGSSSHKWPGIYCSFSFPRHSVLYTDHLSHCLSQIPFLPLANVTFFFNFLQIIHYFFSDHKFCSKLLGFHEPWLHFLNCSHYLKYFLPIWL